MDEYAGSLNPRENTVLFGQQGAEQMLLEANNGGRLHHSLLLSGPKGIGKATLAFRFARHLLKPDEEEGLFGPTEPPKSFDMSENDPIFRHIAGGSHPSLKVLERRRNPETGKIPRDISVSDIRDLSEFYRMTSTDGNWRIAIIDAADDMNHNAANALLKVLEEPPERSVIILISHAPGRLLPTIISRCYKVPLKALDEKALSDALGFQDLYPNNNDLPLLLSLSEGSVGIAAKILQIDGLELYREVEEIVTNPWAGLNKEIDEFVDRLAKNGQDEIYELFVTFFERALSQKVLEAVRTGHAPTPGGELDRWLEVWEKVRTLFAQAKGLGLNRKHIILNAFLHVNETIQQGPSAR
tara:strand:- start:40 stop:1104 length:1065 start_codon:yes stop_codon:yes gene_type:complete